MEVDLRDGDTVVLGVGPGVAATPVVELGQEVIAERPYLTEQTSSCLPCRAATTPTSRCRHPSHDSTAGPSPGLVLVLIAALVITGATQPGSLVRNASQSDRGLRTTLRRWTIPNR